MCHKPLRLGMVILALGVSAGAVPSTSAPLPVTASAQNSASPQNNAPTQSNASSQTEARPTPAQLDQPGAVVIAPPILRNTGTTYAGSDQPLLGRLSLQGQRLPGTLGEQPPPAMPPAPNEAAIGAVDVGALGQAHD